MTFQISDALWVALVSALIGSSFSYLVQYMAFRYRLWSSHRRFRQDIWNLSRHIEASLKSLEIEADSPVYLVAARIRFCKYFEGMSSARELSWVISKRQSRRILSALLAIRNSDIFLEEIACRVDRMSHREIAVAIGEVKTNLRILAEIVNLLRYSSPGSDADFNAEMASQIRSRI